MNIIVAFLLLDCASIDAVLRTKGLNVLNKVCL